MTKAKARARAKANAAKKAQKRKAAAEQAGPKNDFNRFGAGSIKGPSTNVHPSNFGAAKRGAARSR